MPKNHPRRYRIESLVLEALAPMVAQTSSPGIITLRHVSLNNDFSVATVVYTTTAANRQETQQGLDAAAWHYRRRLALTLNMRKTPRLVFAYDDQGLAADKIRAFLENIADNE